MPKKKSPIFFVDLNGWKWILVKYELKVSTVFMLWVWISNNIYLAIIEIFESPCYPSPWMWNLNIWKRTKESRRKYFHQKAQLISSFSICDHF